MKQLANFTLLAASLVIVSCAPVNRAVYDNTKRQPTRSIDLYKGGQKPDRAYKEIGELLMPGHRDNELLRQQQILDEAKRMGGNGLIFTIEPAGINALGVSEYVFKGKVIIYEDQRADPVEREKDRSLAEKLVGHWESISVETKSPGAEKMEFNFQHDLRYSETSIEKGKSYSSSGRYLVSHGKLIIVDDRNKQPDLNDAADISFFGDHLVISTKGMEEIITLKKTR